jgi:hypothetical protein
MAVFGEASENKELDFDDEIYSECDELISDCVCDLNEDEDNEDADDD